MKFKTIGFKKAINKLTKIEHNLNTKIKKIVEKLSDIGVTTARSVFYDPMLVYDGVNDIIVEDAKWVGDYKIEIIARGEAVAFIEFGTGITYPDDHPLSSKLNLKRGSYGQGKGKFSKWAYYGQIGKNTNARVVRIDSTKGPVVLTEGNPPAYGMYNASENIKKNILKIIREELFK